MATRTMLVDDLDGSDAQRTLTFAFDGASYEIELSADNIDKFASDIELYIRSGRKAAVPTTARRRGPAPGSTTGQRDKTTQVRAWANENGVDVSTRGRIPAAVMEAYDAAH